MIDLNRAIGLMLGLGNSTENFPMREAVQAWGPAMAYAWGSNVRVNADKARALLGWSRKDRRYSMMSNTARTGSTNERYSLNSGEDDGEAANYLGSYAQAERPLLSCDNHRGPRQAVSRKWWKFEDGVISG